MIGMCTADGMPFWIAKSVRFIKIFCMDLKIPYKGGFLDMSLLGCTWNFMMVYVGGVFVKIGFSGFFYHRCLLRSAKILWKLIYTFPLFYISNASFGSTSVLLNFLINWDSIQLSPCRYNFLFSVWWLCLSLSLLCRIYVIYFTLFYNLFWFSL